MKIEPGPAPRVRSVQSSVHNPGFHPVSDRVLVIGVDGASLDLLGPWMDRGLLPTFAKFRREGASGTLLSTVHPMSAQAWMSMCTGKNPAAHGIIDFMILEPGTYRMKFANYSHAGSLALWDILPLFGKSAGIVNVPITFPPPPLKGPKPSYLVAGMGAPGTGSEFVSPPELRKEILSRFPKYVIELGTWGYAKRGDREGMLRDIRTMLDVRFETVKFLFKERPTDLSFVVFRATDEIQHHFWRYMDPNHPQHDPGKAAKFGNAILDIYRRVDEIIAELCALLPDATVFLVSDHGSAGNSDKGIYLNSWLAQQGYLRFESGSLLSRARHRVVRAAKFQLRKHLSRRAKDFLLAVFPNLRDRVETSLSFAGIEWAETRAFSEELRPNIWINLKGVRPLGTVERSDYDALRDEIRGKALELRDPETGEPVFEAAYKKEEIYHGKFLDRAPDILLVRRDKPYAYVMRTSGGRLQEPVRRLTGEELRDDLRPNAGHRPNGLVMLRGEAVRPGTALPASNIVDIAPTVLYLMGLPIPADTDGKLIAAAIVPSRLAAQPPKSCEPADLAAGAEHTYSPAEFKHIEDQLRGLGYIE